MNSNDKMQVSLIISTYNFPQALKQCLLSVLRQTVFPSEIIIADDGSTQETRSMIESLRKNMPCPVVHLWQEDKGFRKARIMNRAFAASKGDYIIQIDGDIIMHRHFIEDHLRFARPGYFINGSRAKLTEQFTREALATPLFEPSIWMRGVIRKENAIHFPPLAFLFKKKKHCIGCNMSFWRKDIMAINGYDERIEGYGGEDVDIDARFIRLGVQRIHLKFCAIAYHIWHKEAPTKKDMQKTARLFEANNKHAVVRVKDGIIKI